MITQKELTNVYTQDGTPIPQYSLSKILLIWVVTAFPMGILGWVVAPAMVNVTHSPFARTGALLVGLVWLFVLAMILVYQEAGDLRWSTLRQRLFLTTPRSPRMGKPSARLWWWLIPLVLVTAAFQVLIEPKINNLWVSVFPFFAAPSGFELNTQLASPVARAQLVGAWGIFFLNVILLVFNTFLGEELLFRGVLLPRMAGVFGKGDWVINGVLYGLYHLHQPWGWPSYVLDWSLFFALPSRLTRSTWFGIVAHSGQAVFFTVLILGLVLRWW
ncbi:MAG TPA: CPBP family intramembrane glutamic endopeptidase [Ktedonobacteraceae bacterium]|nr:CPBP family intramembrane glutamic endopeptidase [Ktedonobacteraceae bacterium]